MIGFEAYFYEYVKLIMIQNLSLQSNPYDTDTICSYTQEAFWRIV